MRYNIGCNTIFFGCETYKTQIELVDQCQNNIFLFIRKNNASWLIFKNMTQTWQFKKTWNTSKYKITEKFKIIVWYYLLTEQLTKFCYILNITVHTIVWIYAYFIIKWQIEVKKDDASSLV